MSLISMPGGLEWMMITLSFFLGLKSIFFFLLVLLRNYIT